MLEIKYTKLNQVSNTRGQTTNKVTVLFLHVGINNVGDDGSLENTFEDI